MTLQSCLGNAVAGHQQFLAASEVTFGRMLTVLLAVGVLVAAAAAPFVAASYSRSMRRLIAMREVADVPAVWRQRRVPQPVKTASGQADCTLADAVRSRQRRLHCATWAAYACFVVCGLPTMWMYEERGASTVAWMLAYLALMPLGPALVNLRAHQPGKAPWLMPLVLAAISQSRDPPAPAAEVLSMTVLLLGIQVVGVHRTLRAVTGPLAISCSALLIGIGIFGTLSIDHCLSGTLFKDPSWAAMIQVELMFVAGMAAYALAMALLRWVEHLIAAGWLSDLSLVAGSGLMAIAWLVLALADGKELSSTQVSAYFAAWLGATMAIYALVLHAQPCPKVERSLLVLRVFHTDRRAERMLDALQTRWRLVGPVVEIGGPDLARLNFDLHEVIKLLGFRLPELLHPRGLSDEQLASSLNLAMDREGRFGVNEIYCFDSSWKTMVERLMRNSDVILLDLRGFDRLREGTTHEVQRLAAIGALDRVVVIHDGHTDWEHYAAAVAQGSARASALEPPVQKLDAAQADVLPRSFDALLTIAARRGAAKQLDAAMRCDAATVR